MRTVSLLALSVALLVASLVAVTFWSKYEKMALTTAQAYKQGFEAGKLSVAKSQAQACTAWWFGSDTKERHQQAVEAYCKGKR